MRKVGILVWRFFFEIGRGAEERSFVEGSEWAPLRGVKY